MLKRIFLMIENGLELIANDDDPRPHPPTPESIEKLHEVKDANCLGMAFAGIFLAVSAVLMHLILGLGFQNFKRHELNAPQTEAERPEDYLHGYAPSQPLEQYRSHVDGELNSYGWVDREKQLVRIPIEKAMERRASEK